ncbi:MAG TPA: hypothetical protein VGG72_27365 [Bryobacteraceae bacterium]|jgi:hypothetical protein
MLRLSVVVAAQDAGRHLQACLAVLVPQVSSTGMEVIVADGSGSAGSGLTIEFPEVRFLNVSGHPTVPRLWSAGIEAARGSIVCLTIENCAPAPNWIASLLSAHEAKWPGIGGAIELDPNAGLVDTAVYFCRYSSYILPFSPRFLEDIPGDNCSYKREALEPVRDLMMDGFWETFIHQDMRRRGEQLLSDPSSVVVFTGGLSAWRFFKRRYVHGRYFAARRGRDFTLPQRLVRAVAFPAVFAMLFQRISGRVWRNARHRTRLAMTIPLVGCFLMAWAVGEASGYLAGASAAAAPLRD